MGNHSWGGKALPVLTIFYNGVWIAWEFKTLDRIEPSFKWIPVGKVLRECESGLVRRRQRGTRLRVVIAFENLHNAQFVEFMRRFIEIGEGIFFPHPQQTFSSVPDDVDYWKVIPESDFDFEFFKKRFIGHSGEIVLLGRNTDKTLPVDNSGMIGGF